MTKLNQNRKFFSVNLILQFLINHSILCLADFELPDCDLDEFWKLGNSKFYFSPTAHNWTDAEEECKIYDMTMAKIESSAENSELGILLVTAFKDLRISRLQKVWIGAKSSDNNGIFEWVDGSPILYTNYGSRPLEKQEGKKMCLNVGFSAAESDYLQWRHGICDKYRPFLCETTREECFISKANHHPSLEKIFGTKYYLSLQKLNWADALAFCEAEHLRLVSLPTPTINNELGSILAGIDYLPTEFIFWTSGSHHILGGNETQFFWMSIGEISSENWNAWNAEPNEIQDDTTRQCTESTNLCVEARFVRGEEIEWTSANCMKELPFLCAPRSMCHHQEKSTNPNKWILKNFMDETRVDANAVIVGNQTKYGLYFSYAGTQYFLHKYINHWRGALKSCLSRNMDLYTPDSDKEHWTIANFLWKHKKSKRRCKYWTSGIDLASPHKHYWISTARTITETGKFFERDVQVNISLPTCVFLQLCNEDAPDERNFKWKIVPCRHPKSYDYNPYVYKLSFVCEQRKCSKNM